jgi:ribosome-associated translation inhibitor RaiA
MTSAERIGVLTMEHEALQAQLHRLRQQSSKSGADGVRVQLDIAELETHLRRNRLETLDCQLALQHARISRFDSSDQTDAAISDALRVLTTGLTTLQTRRSAAERELQAAELALERLRASHAARRPGTASTTDHD